MSPDDLIRLRHMLEASDLAIGFASGRSRADLDTDAMLRYALTYAVYADVNRDILWTTVAASLPALRRQLLAVEGM
jgi:uncharacterized protein with HEPN domain